MGMFEDELDDDDITFNTYVASGESQSLDLNETQYYSIIDGIRQQCGTINPGVDNTDFFQVFVKEYLRLPDHEDLEDCTIYVDERLTEKDREKIHEFCAEVSNIYSNSFGINLPDGNIYQLYCIYKIFVLNLCDYFINYILGLQKIDEDFVEDIPNWNELSFKYYLEKINHTQLNDNTKPQIIYDYLGYVFEYGLIAESYIDVALLESEGNVELSTLYIESANYRLTYDSSFFNLKLKKVISSDIEDLIVSRLISLI